MSKAQNNVQEASGLNCRLEFTGNIRYVTTKYSSGQVRKDILVVLDDPFHDEYVPTLKLKPMFLSVKGIFDYRARKELAKVENIPVSGYFSIGTFVNKNEQKCQCVNMFIKDPFFAGELRLKNSNKESHSVVCMLLSDLWGVPLSPYASAKEESADGSIEDEIVDET